MKNNNSRIVSRLITRSLQVNRSRNLFMITAIALTTLLLASVFSIGISLLESIKLQEIRLMGTLAHGAVTKATPEQLERIKALDYVQLVGVGNNAGFIQNTPEMGDMNLTLHYFDQTEWEQLRAPTYLDLVGHYPRQEDEIMMPRWVLERMGIKEPSLGMEIPLIYFSENERPDLAARKSFRLSGWFTSFVHIRSGNLDSLLVSEAFSRQQGKSVAREGAASVLFRDESPAQVAEFCQRLEADLALQEGQMVKPVPLYQLEGETIRSTTVALVLVVSFLILTGYLLIYNVLYISVSRDVRFYGLLKTLGTTPRQIHRLVIGQILRLCLIGIPIGSLAAMGLSLGLVPLALSRLGSMTTGIVVSFSPVIYLGAMGFALLTALLGAFQPARKAAGIAPVEAQRFTGIPVNPNRVYRPAGGKVYRLALRNLFRDKKRAAVVLLSLFLGLTTFQTVLTLVTSMNTDNFVASYVKSDFILKNNTIMGYGEETKQKFDEAFLNRLRALPGLESLRWTTQQWMELAYSEEDFGLYGKAFMEENPEISAKETYFQEHFSGLIAGVDRGALEELNQTLEAPIDLAAFEAGEIALIATNRPELFQNTRQLTVSPLVLTPDSGFQPDPGGNTRSFALGGFVPRYFEEVGSSVAPTLFVSNAVLEQLYREPIRSKVDLNVAAGYEEQVLEALKQMTEGDHEISRTSKLEAQEELRDAKLMLYLLGGGIAFVLAFIGVLNFVNVMSVGIVVRKKELAILESVGMEKEQMKGMLVGEGLAYGLITLLLVMTLGNGITYGIFRLFSKEANYAVFTYPLLPILAAALAILTVCVLTPTRIYASLQNGTLVERLRETE